MHLPVGEVQEVPSVKADLAADGIGGQLPQQAQNGKDGDALPASGFADMPSVSPILTWKLMPPKARGRCLPREYSDNLRSCCPGWGSSAARLPQEAQMAFAETILPRA